MAAPVIEIELRAPVQFGRESEPVTKLELKPTGRAMRDLKVSMGSEGDRQVIVFEPYEFCRVGLRMAGIAGDKAFVDLMDARDIWEVGQTVMGFIVGGQTTGSTPSP